MAGNYENAANAEIARLEAEIAKYQQMLLAEPDGTPAKNAYGVKIIGLKAQLQRARDSVGAAVTQDQSAAAQLQRDSVISSLQNVADGKGQAYGAVMGQVDRGNARIKALAASGRGGINSSLNSQNARALSTASGTQQAAAAKAAEISQARGALGQAIAAGQDYNAAEGQAVLEALRNTPAAAPNQGMQLAGQLGAAGQAVWSANQGSQQNPNDANRKRNW